VNKDIGSYFNLDLASSKVAAQTSCSQVANYGGPMEVGIRSWELFRCLFCSMFSHVLLSRLQTASFNVLSIRVQLKISIEVLEKDR